MLHEEQEPSWVGRLGSRPTFPVSLVMPEDFVRSTTHLGRSPERSTDSPVRMNSEPDLELFCVFLLLLINREWLISSERS